MNRIPGSIVRRGRVLALVAAVGMVLGGAPSGGVAVLADERAESRDRESIGLGNPAGRLLEMEAVAVTVTDSMRRELMEILDEAASAIRGGTRTTQWGPGGLTTGKRWSRDEVLSVLRTIDGVLVRRGFVHPADDRVDLLSEALVPFFMSADERDAAMKSPRNSRRADAMVARFPGPYRAIDCDTAAAVYLGIADRLGLPLRQVLLPSRNRQRGHAWVRWVQGALRVDWETTEGRERRDNRTRLDEQGRGHPGQDRGNAGIELGPGEIVGCWHYLLGVQHERRGDMAAALRALDAALAAFPGHLDARRQLAWTLATLSGVPADRARSAVEHAREVVRRSGDADARDTLAAAYAAIGQFERAIQEERAALSDGEAPEAARAGYRQRLALYQAGRVYRQPGHDGVGRGGSTPP